MSQEPDINPGALAEALNNKTDTDVQNTTNVGSAQIAHFAMPSNKYEDIPFDTSPMTYTAPADGYLHLKYSSSSGQQAQALVISYFAGTSVGVDANECISNRCYLPAGGPVSASIPISKGQGAYIIYSNLNSSSPHICRFVYAIGSEPQP